MDGTRPCCINSHTDDIYSVNLNFWPFSLDHSELWLFCLAMNSPNLEYPGHFRSMVRTLLFSISGFSNLWPLPSPATFQVKQKIAFSYPTRFDFDENWHATKRLSSVQNETPYWSGQAGPGQVRSGHAKVSESENTYRYNIQRVIEKLPT